MFIQKVSFTSASLPKLALSKGTFGFNVREEFGCIVLALLNIVSFLSVHLVSCET